MFEVPEFAKPREFDITRIGVTDLMAQFFGVMTHCPGGEMDVLGWEGLQEMFANSAGAHEVFCRIWQRQLAMRYELMYNL